MLTKTELSDLFPTTRRYMTWLSCIPYEVRELWYNVYI